jgi:hypothetical protein
MSDCVKPEGHSPINDRTNGHRPSNEAGRVLLVGLLGGLASAAGYAVYSRLPDEQKERLRQQVRNALESRISEIRSNLNF